MKRKICFVSLGSLPLLTSDENIQYVGGAEKKQVLVGRELVKRGYIVSFIVYNNKNEEQTKKINDIFIIKSYSRFEHFSSFKKIKFLWTALKKANSDIYIQATFPPGIVALYCFINRKKYIKWLSHDITVSLKDIAQKTKIITKISLYLDFKLADLIIAQNEFQKKIIERRFWKKCILIKNPIILSNNIININEKKNNLVLWVATIRYFKQPEIFLKIARMFPQYRFIMIGGKENSELELYKKIENEVKSISNLNFLGFIPHNKIHTYYLQSSIFINTSINEGFPNTFLEAWNNFTPVVSLNVDPDEVICNKKLGFHSKTFKQMILDIDFLLHNYNLRYEMGINAKKYIKENHDIIKITDQFIDLLESL